jgi:quinol monooxygenase YgiN
MAIDRRMFGLGALAASTLVAARAEAWSGTMYGLISQLLTKPEHRDELVQILAAATAGMPGCLSYVIALDAARDDAIWVTEIWRDRDSHAASLKLPGVQAALAKGRPLIVGMGARTQTHPVAGV